MRKHWKNLIVTTIVTLALISTAVLAGRPLWQPRVASHHDHLQHLLGTGPSAALQTDQQAQTSMFMDLLMGGPLAARAAKQIAAATPAVPATPQPKISKEGGTTVREYTLEITEKIIDYGGGNTWTVWTYNGTVPGPTLRVKVGEILRVRIINHHTRIHSFHTHLSYYPIENDGSQANYINGKGTGAMIPPGNEYTYRFKPERAEVTYYHCHSGDKEFPINLHMLQGLYGMIVVEDPNAQKTGEKAKVTAFSMSDMKPSTWVGPAPPPTKRMKSSGL